MVTGERDGGRSGQVVAEGGQVVESFAMRSREQFKEFLLEAQIALQEAALLSLFMGSAVVAEWVMRVLNYQPPFPIAIALKWLPALALVILVLVPTIRLVNVWLFPSIRQAVVQARELSKAVRDEA
jgi:hypothetical protein